MHRLIQPGHVYNPTRLELARLGVNLDTISVRCWIMCTQDQNWMTRTKLLSSACDIMMMLRLASWMMTISFWRSKLVPLASLSGSHQLTVRPNFPESQPPVNCHLENPEKKKYLIKTKLQLSLGFPKSLSNILFKYFLYWRQIWKLMLLKMAKVVLWRKKFSLFHLSFAN